MATPKTEVKAKTTKTVKKAKVESKLSAPLFALTGEKVGDVSLPESIFGVTVNKPLLTQALRVYQTNQSSHFANTKTRGEVEGSTRKIYKQKGTGGARHGAKRAPIFVGGGIALGPKARKTVLKLPQKMRMAALASALTAKLQAGQVMAIQDLDKASGKTKQMVTLINQLNQKSALLVVDGSAETVKRATRNLHRIDLLAVSDLNAFAVVKYQNILIAEPAIAKIGQGGKNA